MHTRPRYFAQIIGELLYWIGEDRIQFSSDYALWTPKWLIEQFVDFQIPEDLTEYAPLTTAQKKKILGLNAAKMYDIEVPAELQLPDADVGLVRRHVGELDDRLAHLGGRVVSGGRAAQSSGAHRTPPSVITR